MSLSIIRLKGAAQDVALTVDSLSQSLSIDNITLTLGQSLSVDSLTQNQVIENVTLEQGYQLDVNGLSQSISIENISLEQGYNLAIDGLSQSLSLENVVLSTVPTLDVSDLSQGYTLANVALTYTPDIGFLTPEQAQQLREIYERLDLSAAKPNTYNKDATNINNGTWDLQRTINPDGTSTVQRSG